MGFFSDIGGFVFGNSQNSGLLGTGQYRGKEYNIDGNAFNVNGLNSYNQEQDTRNQTNSLAQTLLAQSMGQGPSLAQGQLQDATDRNIAQQQALAASARGVNPALAQRLAAQNVASINQTAASDSALLRNQEQLGAQNSLGSLLTSQRSGDLAATDRDLSARMGKEQLGVQQQTGLNSVNSQAYGDAAKRRGEMISNIGQGVAVMAEGGMVGGKTQNQTAQAKSGVDGAVSQANHRWFNSDASPKGKGLKDLAGKEKMAEAGAEDIGQTAPAQEMYQQKSISTFLNQGGEVPGKAKVAGDSIKNDFVLALLSPGEIIIPRTHADDPNKAKKFVVETLRKEKMG